MASECPPLPYQALLQILERAHFIESGPGGRVFLSPVHVKVNMSIQACTGTKPSIYTRKTKFWNALIQEVQQDRGASGESLAGFPDITHGNLRRQTSRGMVMRKLAREEFWLRDFDIPVILYTKAENPDEDFSLLLPMVLTIADKFLPDEDSCRLKDYIRGHMANVLQGCQALYVSFPPDHEVAKQAVDVIGILEGARRRDEYVEKIKLIRQDQSFKVMTSPVAGGCRLNRPFENS